MRTAIVVFFLIITSSFSTNAFCQKKNHWTISVGNLFFAEPGLRAMSFVGTSLSIGYAWDRSELIVDLGYAAPMPYQIRHSIIVNPHFEYYVIKYFHNQTYFFVKLGIGLYGGVAFTRFWKSWAIGINVVAIDAGFSFKRFSNGSIISLGVKAEYIPFSFSGHRNGSFGIGFVGFKWRLYLTYLW